MTLDVSLDRASANAGIALAGVGQESPSTGWGEGSLSYSVELAISSISLKYLICNTLLHFYQDIPRTAVGAGRGDELSRLSG
jgi:hypothetical protein